LGFVLDMERGYWAKDAQADPDEGDGDPISPRTIRVVPFVEDHRNVLLFEPAARLGSERMASLQAALKHAIQVTYQLEDSELAAEPLPSADDRRAILFYEAAEGGAGVLRRLVEDQTALAAVARKALEFCHFDPDTGADTDRAPGARERCEAACYDCLMSYGNQPDHAKLDRRDVLEVLLAYARGAVDSSPVGLSREAQLERLLRLAASELERRWLRFLDARGYRLPNEAGRLVEQASTRPDFLYTDHQLAVYVDGPVHEFPERAARDLVQQRALEDLGFLVVRVSGDESAWDEVVARYPSVFGSRA